ncbi:MAG TPA: BadF/BadG/BcrA/BcrD ATPase family protein [Dactylosporangium sp.]|jgi:N-acetylglucosamine kinase-like BadF-type ATPase|nr:BadF/BadG/BcrA/BcrD ATPase family protein [Dactylosporangium sp.]
MHDPLVIGVDAGATTSRCVVSDLNGNILGRGAAGGANQNSSGAPPGEALRRALSEALADARADPARVGFGVIGAAGAGAAGREAAAAAAREAWAGAGLGGRVAAVTDLEVGFAAGTPAPDGLLLLAGTGAVGAAFAGGALTHRCDGYGWLLGDEGSAVWLGREALRAVLRALDGRGPATALTDAAIEALGLTAGEDPEARAQAVLRAGFRLRPAELGTLAPLVSDLAAGGDPVARALAEEAARLLLHTLATVAARAGRGDAPGTSVVLAGSVLLSPGPVGDLVRAGVRQRFGTNPAQARDGAAGAAWMAILQLNGGFADPAAHARLTAASAG